MEETNDTTDRTARLRLEPPVAEGQWLTLAASLDDPEGKRHRLWWRVPAKWRHAVTTWADPFVVSFLFPMMRWGRPVFVEGKVSPSLLVNLEAFMAITHAWYPDKYVPVPITAAEEVEPPPATRPGEAVVAFSCGVDACFTVYRHHGGLMGRRSQRIGAAVVMHGFDIWLDEPRADEKYAGLLADAREILGNIGLEPTPMVSNFHELPTGWRHSVGTHLVGGLMLLQRAFDRALAAGCVPLPVLNVRWGNHPFTKPLLGSDRFRVLDDGYEVIRPDKIALLAEWPEALRRLRVCFENRDSHHNCCRCSKCIRTILAFRAAGVPLPESFEHDVTDRQIRNTRLDDEAFPGQWLWIVQWAKAHGRGNQSWMRAAVACVRRNRRRRRIKAFKRRFIPVRNALRRVFRGSPLSRREGARRGQTN